MRFRSLEAADRELANFYDDARARSTRSSRRAATAATARSLPEAEKLVPDAREALADDFNAPVVVAALHAALTLANKLLDEGKGIDKQVRRRTLARLGRDLRTVGAALGVLAQRPATLPRRAPRPPRPRASRSTSPRVEALIAERTAARAAKDFARADAIRDELAAIGVALHDTPQRHRLARARLS